MNWSIIEEVLNAEKSVSLHVKGASMFPELFCDDRVTLCPPKNKSPQVGDIVLVCPHGQYLLHRLVQVGENFYLTRGDNCELNDPVSNKILGVLQKRNKTLKSFLKRLKYSWTS